ncbi:MAG: folate family ECF transporter S component [Oscillospiraceae bacterium]|nr:folate family ECF transporter S component [Oscillospiraceae bacterium]
MKILSIFKSSAHELKSLRCLTTTSLLIAIGIAFSVVGEVDIFPGLRISFTYVTSAIIGMLFGPSVAMLAAIPADILSTIARGFSVNFWLIPSRVLEGMIYGLFLYKIRFEVTKKLAINSSVRIITARLAAMSLCYMVYNTYVLYYVMGLSGDTFGVYFHARLIKNAVQFPVDLALLMLILPVVNLAYRKTVQTFGKERAR